MKNLFNFIARHIHWLLFFFLTFLSLYLLVHNNDFQRSKYLSVFQEIAGRAHFASSKVRLYLNLRSINTDLAQQVSRLEEEIQRYKKELEYFNDRLQPDSIEIGINRPAYHYTHARVTQKQVYGTNNYITLNKGSNQGIKENMAVVSVNGGIVGVISGVTANFSRVMPVINPLYHPTCIIKNTKYLGTLSWDGKDLRYITLGELPSHASYAIGDTVVTSGYSAIFPEGAFVGVIEDSFKRKNEAYNSLKVKLVTDFSTLSEVFIISNSLREEQILIEKGASEE